MCTTYFFLSYRLQTNFLLLFISSLSGKNGKSLCKSCNFLGYLTSTSRIYPFLSFSLELFINSSFTTCFAIGSAVLWLLSHLNLLAGNYLDIANHINYLHLNIKYRMTLH